jgi:hypothetical protein
VGALGAVFTGAMAGFELGGGAGLLTAAAVRGPVGAELVDAARPGVPALDDDDVPERMPTRTDTAAAVASAAAARLPRRACLLGTVAVTGRAAAGADRPRRRREGSVPKKSTTERQ